MFLKVCKSTNFVFVKVKDVTNSGILNIFVNKCHFLLDLPRG